VTLGWNVNASTIFGGTAFLKILKGKKTYKILYVKRQLSSLTANISETDEGSDKQRYEDDPCGVKQKNSVNLAQLRTKL